MLLLPACSLTSRNYEAECTPEGILYQSLQHTPTNTAPPPSPTCTRSPYVIPLYLQYSRRAYSIFGRQHLRKLLSWKFEHIEQLLVNSLTTTYRILHHHYITSYM